MSYVTAKFIRFNTEHAFDGVEFKESFIVEPKIWKLERVNLKEWIKSINEREGEFWLKYRQHPRYLVVSMCWIYVFKAIDVFLSVLKPAMSFYDDREIFGTMDVIYSPVIEKPMEMMLL